MGIRYCIEIQGGPAGTCCFAYVDSPDGLADILFRHLKVDAESAVELSTSKFSRRFRTVEAGAKARSKSLKDMSLEEMDALWDQAKSSS